jgi:hypothetical protein
MVPISYKYFRSASNREGKNGMQMNRRLTNSADCIRICFVLAADFFSLSKFCKLFSGSEPYQGMAKMAGSLLVQPGCVGPGSQVSSLMVQPGCVGPGS